MIEAATPVTHSQDAKRIDLSLTKRVLVYLWLILFPIFFLPITQDFFAFNKLFLSIFISLLLLLLSLVEFVVNKKIGWSYNKLETSLVLILLSSALSIIVSSPNKIQALIYSNFTPILFLSLSVISYYLVKLEIKIKPFIVGTAVFLSILAVIFFFNPLAKANLPNTLAFLKNPYFTPIGSYLDLLVFLGFAFAWQVISLKTSGKQNRLFVNASLLVILVGLLIASYNVIKPQTVNGQTFKILLPPLRLSWYAAVEILKQPKTAIFGVGADNYASIFTIVKDARYNLSDLWQINFFNFGRNVFLHVATVAGLVGLISLIYLFLTILKNTANNKKETFYLNIILLLIFLLVPPSIILWGLLFIMLAKSIGERKTKEITLDLSSITPLYIGIIVITAVFIAALGFLAGRVYAAEYYFKKALDGFAQNNANVVYENHRKAIQILPYVERFRISFAQVNLLLANNLTQQILDEQKKEKPDQDRINNLRQSVTQAIQAAINEAKAAVALNSQKASNWANLAVVYRNILNLAQNADVWTISSYQRAILLDPQNPIYRLNLGGVYYSLNQFDQALRLFEQAVALKPDWANAHYNLAWAAYNTQDYQRAVVEMQNVLNLLDPKQAKADYEKAKKELEEFKKKLQESGQATGPATTPTPTPTPSQLRLPTPAPTIGEKIQLPKEASPEAK